MTDNSLRLCFPFIPRQVPLRRGARPNQPAACDILGVDVRPKILQPPLDFLQSHLTSSELSFQDHPQLSPPTNSATTRGDVTLEDERLKVQPPSNISFVEIPKFQRTKSTKRHESRITFTIEAPPKLPIQQVPIASKMAEPPTKRAKRTDSAAMWDKNESTTAPKPQRPSDDSRDSKPKDTDRDRPSDVKRKRNDERRADPRRRSRSRDRYQSRRDRSRSRERPSTGRDRDRDRGMIRDDRRNRDHERDRDRRGSRRERERSQSSDRHRSSKGWFEVDGKKTETRPTNSCV